jgi:hypothetical protein
VGPSPGLNKCSPDSFPSVFAVMLVGERVRTLMSLSVGDGFTAALLVLRMFVVFVRALAVKQDFVVTPVVSFDTVDYYSYA